MEEITKPVLVGIVKKEAPQLASVLREMKNVLDVVRSKVEALTALVKANSFPTAGGISYLEAKHLLLLSYCQDLVYYILRKAKGLSIDGHPLVRSLVEIRMFLEKVCIFVFFHFLYRQQVMES
jgi:U3 small nucleolar ribonucleoprotein protein LCP5